MATETLKWLVPLIVLLAFLSVLAMWLAELRLTSSLFGDKTLPVIIGGAIATIIGVKVMP